MEHEAKEKKNNPAQDVPTDDPSAEAESPDTEVPQDETSSLDGEEIAAQVDEAVAPDESMEADLLENDLPQDAAQEETPQPTEPDMAEEDASPDAESDPSADAKSRWVWGLLAAAILLCAAAAGHFALRPALMVHKGRTWLEQGDYAGAAVLLRRYAEYGDAAALADQAELSHAQSLLASGDFAKALAIFYGLGAYPGAQDGALATRYAIAQAQLERGNYKQAQSAFAALEEYADAAEMAREAIYRQALAMEQDSPQEALALFSRVPGHGEADAHIEALMLTLGEGPSEDTGEADFALLFTDQEFFLEARGEPGPWYYQSGDITMTVTRARTKDGRRYAVADVRTRNGAAFYSGSAYGEAGTTKVEMPVSMARRYHAVLGFTGDFLRWPGNAKGVMIRQGKVYYEENKADVMALLPGGAMEVYPMGSVTAQELLDKGVENAYAFGPILLMDGKFYEPALRHRVAGNNRRCAIGMIEPGHYIVMASTSGFPARGLAELFASYGCTVAYNMDGGHSASLIILGEQLNSQPYESSMKVFQRAIPDMIFLGESPLTPDIDAPLRYTDTRTGTKK